MYCHRCREQAPLNEWRYRPQPHAWRHVKEFEVMNAQGAMAMQPCGWLTKIPAKVWISDSGEVIGG